MMCFFIAKVGGIVSKHKTQAAAEIEVWIFKLKQASERAFFMSGEKTMQENTLPWVIKLVPAVVGAILALVLSGDIDKEGKIQVTLGLIGKFLFSVSVSLYGGAAFIEYYELNQYSHMAQGFVMLIFAVFGLLTIGIVYQSIALMQGKSIAEVITEVKAAFVAIIGGGKWN